MQPLCRRLQRVDGNMIKLFGQSFLHHIGQGQCRQPMSLKDLRQHPDPLKSPITAAETDQRLPQIAVPLRAEQLPVKAVCLEAVSPMISLF